MPRPFCMLNQTASSPTPRPVRQTRHAPHRFVAVDRISLQHVAVDGPVLGLRGVAGPADGLLCGLFADVYVEDRHCLAERRPCILRNAGIPRTRFPNRCLGMTSGAGVGIMSLQRGTTFGLRCTPWPPAAQLHVLRCAGVRPAGVTQFGVAFVAPAPVGLHARGDPHAAWRIPLSVLFAGGGRFVRLLPALLGIVIHWPTSSCGPGWSSDPRSAFARCWPACRWPSRPHPVRPPDSAVSFSCLLSPAPPDFGRCSLHLRPLLGSFGPLQPVAVLFH